MIKFDYFPYKGGYCFRVFQPGALNGSLKIVSQADFAAHKARLIELGYYCTVRN